MNQMCDQFLVAKSALAGFSANQFLALWQSLGNHCNAQAFLAGQLVAVSLLARLLRALPEAEPWRCRRCDVLAGSPDRALVFLKRVAALWGLTWNVGCLQGVSVTPSMCSK